MKEGLKMATNKKNIRQQLRNELFNQYKKGKGKSRHEAKKQAKSYAIYDQVFSKKSLETHLSRADQFAKWIKAENPEIKTLAQIDRQTVINYLNSQRSNHSIRTAESDMSMLNRVKIGRGDWSKEDRMTKKEAGLDSRSKFKITNNRTKKEINYSDKQQKIIDFGRAFGLRRSELVPDPSQKGYAVTANSLFEKNDKVYLATFGKGRKFRTIEVLKESQDFIQKEYGECIQKTEILPDAKDFRYLHENGHYLFDSISNNVQIHLECRQYYADHKLNEIEEDGRRFELLAQNRTPKNSEFYTTNGRRMLRDQAQFVSQQLGHNRIYELKSYVNLG